MSEAVYERKLANILSQRATTPIHSPASDRVEWVYAGSVPYTQPFYSGRIALPMAHQKAKGAHGFVMSLDDSSVVYQLEPDDDLSSLPIVFWSANVFPALKKPLEARFQRLRDEWKAESTFMSSDTEMAMLPAYQKIIGMGPAAVPLILAELAKEPGNWFWALVAITDTNPVPETDRGVIERMAEHWLAWGRKNRLI